MISLYRAYLVRIPPFQVPEMFGDFMNTRIWLNSRRVFMMKEILASEFRHHLFFGKKNTQIGDLLDIVSGWFNLIL